VMGPFDGSTPECSYVALDTHAERDATLSVRDDPSGPGEIIPRERWQFVDPHSIAVAGGFELGKTYELTYTAVGAPITGVGLLAIRDVVAYLRRAPEWVGQIDFALAMGASQTGRLLRQMLYQGFCEDEQDRLVLDGILAIAAGARMTEANWRFGQPSAQGSKSAVFPFTDAIQIDPVSGQTDGLLRRALQRGKVPRVIHLNTSSEYCSSAAITHVSAALSHLTADGKADVDVPANVRIYHCAGTQHAASPLPLALSASDVPTGRGVYFPNTIDYKPFVRAAVDNLYAWVAHACEPPPSRYPRVDNRTLVDREVVRHGLPRLPGPGLPARAFYAQRSGASGFDACSASVVSAAASVAPDLVPAVDADGNEVAGLQHPDLAVPLATYTGWNPRHPETGGARLLVRATGSTIPFPRTPEERIARDDPRPSIAERYASRDAYLERVRTAAMRLVEQRYLIESDVEEIVDASGRRYDEFLRLDSLTP
jgi:Alpha/beta hydrolase domain